MKPAFIIHFFLKRTTYPTRATPSKNIHTKVPHFLLLMCRTITDTSSSSVYQPHTSIHLSHLSYLPWIHPCP